MKSHIGCPTGEGENIGPFTDSRDLRHRNKTVERATRSVVEALEERRFFSFSLGTALSGGFGGNITPGSFAIGDINRDGNNDVIISNVASGSAVDYILLGQPGGTFVSGTQVGFQSTVSDAAPMLLTDINGDGFLDIIQTVNKTDNSGAGVAIALGQGNGTFAVQTLVSITGLNPLAIAVGDFNKDFKPDLFVSTGGVGNASPGTSLLLGNNDGTFTVPAGSFADHLFQNLAVADFDGDGNPDVASPFGVQFDKVDATFNTTVAYPAGVGFDNVVTADFNVDNKPDIALAPGAGQPGQAAAVTVLLNNGDGTFTASTVPIGTGLTGVVGLTAGDIDADGIPDLVATLGASAGAQANTVAVLHNVGNGTFTSEGFYPIGGNAGPVLLAKFSSTVKTDAVVLDVAAATVFDLPNTTAVDSTTVLTSSLNPAVQGQVVQLNAAVTGQGGTTATGTVNFMEGATLLGSVAVSANGIASFVTTTLSPGDHGLTAVYSGDATYKPSTSAALTQTVQDSATLTTAAIDVQIGQLILPAIVVPGDKGSIKLVLSNLGTVAAIGRVAVRLYMSTHSTIDSNSVLLIAPSLNNKAIRLLPGKTLKLTGKFTLPLTLSSAPYQILAQVNALSGIDASTVSTGYAPSSIVQVVSEFGTVGTRKNIKLVQPTSDGGFVTYALSGPGTGTVSGIGISVNLVNTTLASTLKISKKGGNVAISIDTLNVSGSLASFNCRTVVLGTGIGIHGNIRQLTLGNLASTAISIDGNLPVKLNFGNVDSTSIVTGGAITSLICVKWTGTTPGSVAAQSIGSLTCPGEFDARLSLHGSGLALRLARIGSSVGGLWGVAGNVGRVLLNGAWTNGGILAGTNFGVDNARLGGDDTTVAGAIGALLIGGAVSQCLFAGGLDPADGLYLNGNDILVPGGVIGNVVISGTLGPESRIVAAKLPPIVEVNRAVVDTGSDPRFKPA